MPADNVKVVTEGEAMERMKVIWTFNPITIGSIVLTVIAGTVYVNTIKNQADNTSSLVTAMSVTVTSMSDLPYRMKQQEAATAAQSEKDKAQDARIDRQTDLILNGQDNMRSTMQAGFDGMRKDMSILSTKVEVIGSKVDMAAGKPTPRS